MPRYAVRLILEFDAPGKLSAQLIRQLLVASAEKQIAGQGVLAPIVTVGELETVLVPSPSPELER